MFIIKSFTKYFTLVNIVLALIMFVVFFILRNYLLPPSFTLSIDQLPNITFEFSISKDLCAGIIGLFIRLGLKGIIEDLFAEWFPIQKIPNSLIMMSEQNKGNLDQEVSGPSGSGGSGEPSGEPLNSSEKPVDDKGGRVITDSDYEWDSDFEDDKFPEDDDSQQYPESEANKLIYGPTENIQRASKELLEETLKAADFIRKDYEKRCVEYPLLKAPLTDITRKQDLIIEELEKIEKGEREDIIKEDKGKGKKKIK